MQETIRRNKPESKKDLCFIIYGSRYAPQMRSFGPKYLYKDSFGKPILETQIQAIHSVYPNAEIVVVGGYEIDRLSRFKSDTIRIVENQIYEDTNEIEDLRLAINNTNKKNIVTISADVHFNPSTIKSITNDSCILFDTKHQLADSDLGMTIVNSNVERIDVSLEKKWCHICYFEGKHFYNLKKHCLKRNGKLFLFEVLNTIIDTGIIFKGVEPNNMTVYKLHTPDHLRNFKKNIFV